MGEVHTSFNLMLSQNVVPVVLRLPGIHESALREGAIGAVAKGCLIVKNNLGQGIGDVVGGGFGADGVSAKLHIQAIKPDAGFIDHPTAEVVSPAYQDSLT